jgi:hypothetical protein
MRQDEEGLRMTEQEWLQCSSPDRMLPFIEPLASARKLRLFACAVARSALHLLGGELRGLATGCLEAGEKFADGAVSAAAVEAARAKLRATPGEFQMAATAVWSALTIPSVDGWESMAVVAAHAALFAAAATDKTNGVVSPANSHLLRDIIGPSPFHAVAFSAEWRSDAAVGIARRMYEARDFFAMPILADALRAAGCEEQRVFGHCRGPGPHVRGCWVVDMVLGKE